MKRSARTAIVVAVGVLAVAVGSGPLLGGVALKLMLKADSGASLAAGFMYVVLGWLILLGPTIAASISAALWFFKEQ